MATKENTRQALPASDWLMTLSNMQEEVHISSQLLFIMLSDIFNH